MPGAGQAGLADNHKIRAGLWADPCFAPEGDIGIYQQVNNLVSFQSTEKKSKYGYLF